MPKSKQKLNRRKKGYRKPQKSQLNNITQQKREFALPIDYQGVINKLINGDNYNIHQVSKIQQIALNDALMRFNKETLIIPCEAERKYAGAKKIPKLVYHSHYQDVKKAIINKLIEFDLFFAFTEIEQGVEAQSGMNMIQVKMDVCHKLGGKISASSKPSLIMPCNIDGEQLTPDQCISKATTKAKKDVISGSIFNVVIEMPECYLGELKDYSIEEWNPISSEKINILNEHYRKIQDRIYFQKYLKETYNVRGIRRVRGYQFEHVLFDLKTWQPIAKAS